MSEENELTQPEAHGTEHAAHVSQAQRDEEIEAIQQHCQASASGH